MTANVPTSENGSAKLGMIVAERLRRNRKMTRTTSARVRNSVNFTSVSEARIDSERSERSCRRSEEHTSELQSQSNLVCRLLLEKKKKAVTIERTTCHRSQ